MKKFLLPLMLAFAILIPTVQVSAADVPNFRRVAGDSVRGGKSSNEKGYRVYPYNFLGYNENFAEQYLSLLQKKGLTLIDHKEKREEDWTTPDFWLENARIYNVHYDDWFFDCKGHQVVFSLSHHSIYHGGKNPSRKDHMYFHVKVANELTYEEDF